MRSLSPPNIESELSYAYLPAVASHAGMAWAIPSIQAVDFPALQCAHIDAGQPTGRLQPRSLAMSRLDPLRTSLAIFQHDYSVVLLQDRLEFF